MHPRKTNRIKNLHRLEARYIQLKRAQLDRRSVVWGFWGLVAGLLIMALISWLAK